MKIYPVCDLCERGPGSRKLAFMNASVCLCAGCAEGWNYYRGTWWPGYVYVSNLRHENAVHGFLKQIPPHEIAKL